jgi:hypothetical protein
LAEALIQIARLPSYVLPSPLSNNERSAYQDVCTAVNSWTDTFRITMLGTKGKDNYRSCSRAGVYNDNALRELYANAVYTRMAFSPIKFF